MEIIETEKYCIITMMSPKLTSLDSKKLFQRAELYNGKKIGIDLSFVKDCTIDFLDCIKNLKNVSLFNIPSDIFATLLNMNMDKVIPLFVSELDFTENKRRLLNRKFFIV